MAYRDAKNFFDRELSWLAFNRRVLEEALDSSNPLLERFKFLTIVATNLDEFFMVRVSGVQEQVRSGIRRKSIAGLAPEEAYSLIHEEAHRQTDQMLQCYRDEIVPALAAEDIHLTSPDELPRQLRKELKEIFDRDIFPILTPLAVDSAHPFPHLRNLSLNLIVHLQPPFKPRTADPMIAIVQVPSMLPRVMEVPCPRERKRFVLLEDLIRDNVNRLFPGLKVLECVPFRVTRDADIEYKEIDAEDLLKYIETEIRERERGMAVRLQIDHRASTMVSDYLSAMLNLDEKQVYRVDGPIAIAELAVIWRMSGRDHLRDEPFTPNIRPRLRGSGSIFSMIRRGDILLHHPYESFMPVVDFIKNAADDPKVLAIKQTLYRTSGDSPIIKSLIRAAENGKQVAALVELKARFDEENNIVWARQLEEAGVHVVYGLVGLKTHCKVALVVRREGNSIRRYVHLGTGNYNPTTARLYTDLGMFTCDPTVGEDASELFNLLTGYAHAPRWQELIIAPHNLRQRTLDLINEEREKAEAGKPARIRAKVNSLVDQDVIVELYRASRAGVQIDLVVRGVCCLRPGVKDLSENIRVTSVVGRFLEHSRIYIFGADPNPKVFLSSADWMDRNLDRRIEVMFPILDPLLKKRCIEEIFSSYLLDNAKTRVLQPDGKYRRAKARAGEAVFNAQEEFLALEERIANGDRWDVPQAPAPLPLTPSSATSDSKSARRKRKAGRRRTTAAKAPVADTNDSSDAVELPPIVEPEPVEPEAPAPVASGG